jgi:hypothetical protein
MPVFGELGLGYGDEATMRDRVGVADLSRYLCCWVC